MSAIMRRLRRNAMTYQLEEAGIRKRGGRYKDIRRAWLERFGDPLQKLILSRLKNKQHQVRTMPAQGTFLKSARRWGRSFVAGTGSRE